MSVLRDSRRGIVPVTVYGHFGPKTSAEVSTGHFSTAVKIRDTSALVPKCLGHFGTTYK